MSISQVIHTLCRASWQAIFARLRPTVAKQQFVFTPRVDGTDSHKIKTLGTKYGGWSYVEDERFYGGTIISCGLGEDASFDVEFASKYGATIILVDPTIRAIKHFEKLIQRIGLPSETHYVEGGNQPVTSYDLSRIDRKSLQLVPKALWIHNERVAFFSPPNPAFVSHSITDLHNNYSKKGVSYEVECITIDRLLQSFGMNASPLLLKMDIEGAETQVIKDMITKGIYPDQILVEFEELQYSSRQGQENVEEIDGMLRNMNYRLSIFSPPGNFSYTRK